jgi:hypothetical protein
MLLPVMPSVRRDDSSLDVFVDPRGIMTIAFRDSKVTIKWYLNGYPRMLVGAIERFEDGGFILQRFEVAPSGEFYCGYLCKADEGDLIELHLNDTQAHFCISMRLQELTNLKKILNQYWTC